MATGGGAHKPRDAAVWAGALSWTLVILITIGGRGVLAAAGSIAITVTSPTRDESFSSAPIVLSGGVSDPGEAITAADFTVKDRYSGLYLRTDGTLGSREVLPLTLSDPGTSNSSWSATIPKIPATEFQLVVFVDAFGGRYRNRRNPVWNRATSSRRTRIPDDPVGQDYLVGGRHHLQYRARHTDFAPNSARHAALRRAGNGNRGCRPNERENETVPGSGPLPELGRPEDAPKSIRVDVRE